MSVTTVHRRGLLITLDIIGSDRRRVPITDVDVVRSGKVQRFALKVHFEEANHPPVIQLRKACRLLDACRTLREYNGYHTNVIEMSFTDIEQTLEFYALAASNSSIDSFQNYTRAYDRAAALGVFSEYTARRLKTLYTDNRSAAYYRDYGGDHRAS